MLIGHRGAPGHRPEHSRSSYLRAFAAGVDAVEPDLVPTRDGVLVVRHESEIGATTDVSAHPEFADRRVTKTIDGVELTGWFTEDFTWEELSTLRCRERIPALRPDNRAFNDTEPVLRFTELLDLLEEHNATAERPVGLVAEIKHPTYFGTCGFDMACMTRRALTGRPWGEGGYPLWYECFERTALLHLAEHSVTGKLIYLIDDQGAAPDDVAVLGERAHPYSDALTLEGLSDLSEMIDGISPSWRCLISTSQSALGQSRGVVERAHEVGLSVFTWTLRPENYFLAEGWTSSMDPARWGNWRGEFSAILDTGVDAVFADYPELVTELLAEEPR